jgi:bifunctional glutamyl/prolyl-tRNA synthetase
MEWDKIWAFNKKVLDPVVPRHTTVDLAYRVPVHVSGVTAGSLKAARHPKNPDVGEKTVHYGPTVLIDGADAEQLKAGENATFINWGNLLVKAVNRGPDGKVTSVEAEDNTDNKDFKKTLKLTWLCADEARCPLTPVVQVYYDHIISKAILDKDDDFKQFVGKDTKLEVEMLGDPELKSLKKGDIVQVQRRGFFICDSEYEPYSQVLIFC